jgi:hypothetical protein
MTETDKRKLRDEIYLKNRILAEGIAFEPDIFRHLALGVEYAERVHCMFSRDKHWHSGVEFPDYFLTPEGNYWVRIHWNTDSPLSLRYEDGQYNVYDGGKAVFEKYKAAGYRTIATNLEIWNEKLFDVICPGKSQLCGGRKNCLAALDEELRVFGRHWVRSSLVSGIEPKASLLEGVEYLAERGVLPVLEKWNVAIGSRLEGHRTPAQNWHWDVSEKTAALYKKYGFSWEEIKSASVYTNFVPFDLFRLEAGIEAKEPVQAGQTAA